MEIGTFDAFVTMCRNSFRHILNNNLTMVYYEEDGENKVINFKDWILKVCLNDCRSEFEKQTMVENLKEEFEDFVKGLGE